MISTSGKVAVIDTTLGMEVLCYSNRLETVLSMMESARIAPVPEYFGSVSHEDAVRNIREHCDVVLAAITADRVREAGIGSGEIEPEQA
jgi:hypothetical protein